MKPDKLYMPFTRNDYPASFRMLRQDLLKKAVEIGNALLIAGYKENMAEVIALANAKLWPTQFGTFEKMGKLNVHMVPHPKGWALISLDASIIYFICSLRKEALIKARSFAKNAKLKLYIHSPIGNISDSESFAVNRPKQEEMNSNISNFGNQELVVESTEREAIRGASWLVRKIRNNLNDAG